MFTVDCGIALDKASIRTRLEWIIASRPEANPSRATLKRVNEFLLTAPFHGAVPPSDQATIMDGVQTSRNPWDPDLVQPQPWPVNCI